jgi:N utilization substance protein B
MSDNPAPKKPLPPKMLQRSAARLGAVQLLFQQESSTKTSLDDALSGLSVQLLDNMREGDEEEGLSYQPDMAFLRQIVDGSLANATKLDDAIIPHLSAEWRYERIDPVLRAILRASAWEFSFTETPTNVIINEYIEVAKAFFEHREIAFVNGFLDQMSKRLRPAA